MPTVPLYQDTQQRVALRPEYTEGYNVRADADAFGASIGRGMQSAANGLGAAADAALRVQELDDVNAAKDADNRYAEWSRNAMYGENGFMNLEGRAAIDGRADFEKQADQKRTEFGNGLAPGAAKHYNDASQARMSSLLESSIQHSARERKSWFNNTSNARVETFANDALAGFGDPSKVNQSIASGVAELQQQAHMLGWDSASFELKKQQFISGVTKNIVLRMAQDDPLAADKYMKANSERLSGSDQYELKNSLQTELENAESQKYADDVLAGSRKVSDLPGDIVGEVAAAGGPAIDRPGPTRARSFLLSKLAAGHGPEHIAGLNESFATNLAAMIQDAPPEVRKGLGIVSGTRTHERQVELFEDSDKTGRTVAFPAGYTKPDGSIAKGSKHEDGEAVDFGWNGQLLKPGNAPQEVIDWVHQNASKYGIYFPMDYEPWHTQPVSVRGSTAVQRSAGVSVRASMPSYDDIETTLSGISNPRIRELTRKRLYAAIEMRSKAEEANTNSARAQLWNYVDQGKTPDEVPMEIRQQAGMSAVSSAWSYLETAAKGRDVDSDETLLYQMRRQAATSPTEFSGVDLNEYRDRLSKEAIKELTGLQTNALTDERKAKEDGMNVNTAFSQASQQLEAVGLTTTGKKGSDREDAARRIAIFQNSLVEEMQSFKRLNKDKPPTQPEIQQMINRLLLPIVIKTPGSVFGNAWSSTKDGFMFEAGNRPDNSTAEPVVKYEDVPIDIRLKLSTYLESKLGRKPSQQEVSTAYVDFILSRK
ncbi:hypothetical protein EOS93_25170 [Rhizobium sp. RMa-01]|uniref:M15 family metallopeptidase n=1 Tax=unclassified Rhizobium TaxID=2613769 RepID=UPI0008DA5C10|nr:MULTISPECIES: M15 family metallopeptidase [unclassified Rhizobium]OHV24947.1 hypothetical protein BBJ66_22665 [Rhizobium sp. RSm-3]RVU08347.1 hypothetical protein EOS93_25170 [Rhizobium sp. RMa-01]